MWMKTKTHQGFTIVELLVVIVVISILSTIIVLAYTGVQTKATNASRLNEISTWDTLFQA